MVPVLRQIVISWTGPNLQYVQPWITIHRKQFQIRICNNDGDTTDTFKDYYRTNFQPTTQHNRYRYIIVIPHVLMFKKQTLSRSNLDALEKRKTDQPAPNN